jgi:hypothetical protein
MSEKLPAQALRHHRETAITLLCEHFTRDNLEAGELEALIDRAHQATTLAELEALTAELPGLGTASPPTAIAPPEAVRDSQTVVAIMGGTERAGSWVPARSVYAVAVMGGIVLDFRDSHLSSGTTEVQIFALMGGVEVIVPPGLRVESDGIGIMGGFEHAAERSAAPPAGGPVLRITGVAIMGGVEITERLPGESARDAKLRRRRERKLRDGDGVRRLERGDRMDHGKHFHH